MHFAAVAYVGESTLDPLNVYSLSCGNKQFNSADLMAFVEQQVGYVNMILPLAELEAQLFPLIQSCVFPKWLAVSEDVRKASAGAENKIDTHILMCRQKIKGCSALLNCATTARWYREYFDREWVEGDDGHGNI